MSARSRRIFTLFGAFIMLGALATPSSAAVADAELQTLTVGPAASWLGEHGLTIEDVDVQSGRLVYAGPNCPGGGFTCVAIDGPLVQFVADGGVGIIECDSSDCVVFQHAQAAQTVTDCNRVERGNDLDQTCDVTTNNVDGDSTVVIHMEAISRNPITSTGEVTQSASQSATCSMTNVNGRNDLQARLLIDQFADINVQLPVAHTQEARQALSCTQTNDTGDNNAVIDTDQILRSEAIGTRSSQRQNTYNDAKSTSIFLDQFKNGNKGGSTATVEADQTFNMKTLTVGGESAQYQGPFDAAGNALANQAPLEVRILQDGGKSTYDADLTRNWVQEEDAVLGSTSEADNGQNNDLICCLGDLDLQQSPTRATAELRSRLVAPDGAFQQVSHTGRMKCSISCEYLSHINFDDQDVTEVTKSGKAVGTSRSCQDGSACEGNAAGFITFIGGVRCEDPCGNTIYQMMDEGPAGDGGSNETTIGSRWQVQGFTEAGQPLSDLVVTVRYEADNVRVLRAPGCQDDQQAGELTCSFGIGSPGGVQEAFIEFGVLAGAAQDETFTFNGEAYAGNNPNIPPVHSEALFRINNA